MKIKNPILATLRRKYSKYGLRIIKSRHSRDPDSFHVETIFGQETVLINTSFAKMLSLLENKEWCQYWMQKNTDICTEIYQNKPEVFS
ncbi:MAG: hypothetical protein HWQ38_18975 [Nostoc sp. NMS7]|uniref:hypothetical protein n=1 Tax=Nostoc sp. NMS7 TaxID=2815391 RepID=UPI0025E4E0FB|nr:hypothetical protein [Nostoc sp. NMS7]MBN3948420.1 hypothetical protein [Nostoc sp. NMS7]